MNPDPLLGSCGSDRMFFFILITDTGYSQCCGSGSADLGSGAFCPLDPGWVKNQHPGSGSVMNNPDDISESLKAIFWV